MENYHLHRPEALECSPASSPISLQEGNKSTNWELIKSLKDGEGGRVNYVFQSQLHIVNEEQLISRTNDTLTNSFNLSFSSQGRRLGLHRV